MGADLILAWTPVEDREVILDRINHRTIDDDLSRMMVECRGEDDEPEAWDLDDPDKSWQDNVRQYLREDVAVLFADYRDSTRITIDGKDYIFAGGTSYGDSPEMPVEKHADDHRIYGYGHDSDWN